ncbi:hypothetical protein DFQ28_009876 [Apophysomyces sp. BC1034]|nr:hypothetical protein DFQ28_009876 [Apophysomyces sp. BC1034]
MRCKKRFGAPDFKPIPPTPGGWDEVKPSREVAWEKTTEMFAEYSPYFNVKSMNDDELSEKCPWKVVSWETRLQNHPTLGDNHGAATKFKNNDQALTTNVTIQIRPDDTDAQKTTKSSPSPNFINVKGIDPLQPHQPASTYPSVSHLPENNTDISWWSDRTWQPVLPPQNNDQVADRYLKTRPASHNSNSTSFSNSYSPLIWIPPKEESQSLHRDELYKLDKQTRHRQHQPLQRLWESQQHNWATSHDYPYFGPSSPLWSVDISSTSVWSPKDDLRISSESQPTGLIKANEPLTSERYQDRKCGVSEQTDWTGIEDRFLSILKVVDEDGFRPPVNRQCGRMTENSSDRCRHCGASSHLVFRNCPFIPLLDPKQAWVRVLQACERLDIDLFMESLALYSKSRPDETLQDISGKLCDYGSKLQLLAVERDLPQTATVMDLQGRILCRYVALAVVLEIDDHGKDPLHSLSYLPGFPPTWEQNFLRLADAGFFSDKNQIPICRPCGRTGHWLADCVQSQLAINEGVFTRRHFSNHFDRRSNKHDPNEAYRLYYNMDDYVVVHNT